MFVSRIHAILLKLTTSYASEQQYCSSNLYKNTRKYMNSLSKIVKGATRRGSVKLDCAEDIYQGFGIGISKESAVRSLSWSGSSARQQTPNHTKVIIAKLLKDDSH
jgi:hypothetical protein